MSVHRRSAGGIGGCPRARSGERSAQESARTDRVLHRPFLRLAARGVGETYAKDVRRVQTLAGGESSGATFLRRLVPPLLCARGTQQDGSRRCRHAADRPRGATAAWGEVMMPRRGRSLFAISFGPFWTTRRYPTTAGEKRIAAGSG